MAWPPRFLFISGRLALDFVHTGGEGFRARWERWATPTDLAEWLEACPGLQVRARVSADDLRAARALREAVWSCAQAAIAGAELPAPARAVIVRAAARPDLVPTLRGGVMTWATSAKGAQALSRVARDAIELFGTTAAARLRRCQNPRCYLLFVDTSRAGERRWCTMRRCGNLAKLARYRGRPAPRAAVARASRPSKERVR